MAEYSEFKYSAEKYGVTANTSPRWGLSIDWDGDGFYDNDNEAANMTGLVVDRGRGYFISSGNDGFERLSPGRATITLSNHDGRYNPYNASSPLYPNVDIGKFAQVRVKYGSTPYPVLTGAITDIRIMGNNETVEIVVEDGIEWLSSQAANHQPPVATDRNADAIIGRLLNGSQWPVIWGRDLGNGSDFYFYWWSEGGSAWDEIQKLLDSELATYCVKADGKFFYRPRQFAGTSVLSLTEDKLEKGIMVPVPWEFRKNIVKFTGNQVTRSADKIIWQSTSDIPIAPGASQSVTAEFSNPFLPTNHATITAFTQSGGAGTNVTSSITKTFQPFATDALSSEFILTNIGAVLAYVHTIDLYGLELTTTAISGSASGAGSTTSPRSFGMDLTWNQTPNALTDFASQMLAFLNTTQPFPIISIDNRPDIQFIPDLFDIVTVDLSTLGINSIYRVGGIRHEWTSETGKATTTTFNLEPYRAYTGYWLFDSDAILDTSLLGW